MVIKEMNRNQVINIKIILLTQILMTAGLGKISDEKLHRMSCRREATFKAIQTGFVVKASSSQLISAINITLLPHCARSCIKTDSCKSLVYRKKPATTTEKNCQLLKVEKSSLSNTDIESSAGWTYYEPLQQVCIFCTVQEKIALTFKLDVDTYMLHSSTLILVFALPEWI